MRGRRLALKGGTGSWTWGPAAFFLVLWQVLLWVQNPGLMSDDSGEMVAASVTLGLPHPPGYPLYCLLGRMLAFLPVGTPAFRFDLLSAGTGLLAILFVLEGLRLLLVRAGAGTGHRLLDLFLPLFVGATLALDRTFMAQALSAKGLVYMLSLLMISVLFHWRIRRALDGPGRGPGRGLYPVLFLFALGFTHHWPIQLLLTPFLLLWHFQEKNLWNLRNTFHAVSFALLALSVLFYLPLRAGQAPAVCWGDPQNLRGLLWILERRLAVPGETGEMLFRPLSHYSSWGGEWLRTLAAFGWPGSWAVVVLGLLRLAVIRRDLFLSAVVLYGTVLGGFLTVPRDETLFLLPVYLVTLQGILALALGLGIAYLLRILLEWRSWAALLFAIFLCWTLFLSGVVNTREVDRSRYTLASDLGENALKDLPRGGLFLAEGDHMLMPLWYLQEVQGLRKDLLFQPAPFLLHDWGWRQMAIKDGRYRSATLPGQTFQQRLGILAKGPRPVFYSLDRGYLGQELEKMEGSWVLSGLVFRWERDPDDALGISRRVMASEKARRFRGIREYLVSKGRDPSSEETLHYYAQPHFLAAHALVGEGHYREAVDQLLVGVDHQPRVEAYRDLAVLLGKLGKGDLAESFAESALELQASRGGNSPK